MNIKEFKKQASILLNGLYEPPELRQTVNALFRELARIPSYWYHTEEEHVFDPVTEQALLRALERLSQGEPIQYVLGYVTFGGCRIEVDSRVLIPRPETEELLGHIIPTLTAGVRVLDACTGSGALAVALKKAIPQAPMTSHISAEVFACDLSDPALAVARQNALQNHAPVSFFKTDVLDTAGFVAAAAEAGIQPATLDCMVSNPPYVTEKEKALMSSRVLDHEPSLALFVPDSDALCFYRALSSAGKILLKKGGCLWVEINEAYGAQTQNVIMSDNFSSAKLHKDFLGKDRFLEVHL